MYKSTNKKYALTASKYLTHDNSKLEYKGIFEEVVRIV